MEKNKYQIALTYFPKFGAKRTKKLQKYFPKIKHVFSSSQNELIEAGIEPAVAEEFLKLRDSIEPDKILAELEKEKIKVINLEDDDYPSLLKEIYDPPPLIFYKGNISLSEDFPLGVVGTRKYSSYGKSVTELLVRDLVNNGLTIISGLARGIDSIAHETTLKNNGRTLAVLASGVDRKTISSNSNYYLAERIIEKGAIISELPPGTLPMKYHFPLRNRIIAGLSLGTLIIEAPKKSGALITAFQALEQNREIFAIPQNIINPNSEGVNMLIKKGAKLVTEVKDILETLNLKEIKQFQANKKIIPDSKEEELVLRILQDGSLHIDEVARKSNLPASIIASTITLMEIKGTVKNDGRGVYRRVD